MLVSHRKSFIYTKTVKTGGTSVESYFEPFCMPDHAWALSHERDEYISADGIVGYRGAKPPDDCQYWNHQSAAAIREKVGAATWNRYFKFCVVRNPYDKAVSAFYFYQKAINGFVEFGDLDAERAKFESWLNAGSQIPLDRDKYLIDGKFGLDAVIRYESLSQDLARLCQRLNIRWEPAKLPTFKTGIRPPQARTEDLYTSRSQAIIEAHFAFELDYFHYTFPTQRPRFTTRATAG